MVDVFQDEYARNCFLTLGLLRIMASSCVITFTNKKRKNSRTKVKVTNCLLLKAFGNVSVSGHTLLIVSLLLCIHHQSAVSVLIEKPRNATVLVHHSTFFNCSKSNNKPNEPTWYHYPLLGIRQEVYDYKKIIDKYADRFSIDKNISSGTFNLLVLRAEITDAGRYECIVEDDDDDDPGASAELTVLESDLVCESNKDLNEVIGLTECAKPIAPDQLQLSCSVTYSGNIPPQMQWGKAGNALESMGITNCDIIGNRSMCNATLEANLYMGSSAYICEIITGGEYNCSLEVNKAVYIFSNTSVRAIKTTDEVICSANTSGNLPCSYKWYKDNTLELLGQTMKPRNPGLYRCEAECKIRNETCAFTAMVINATEPDPELGPSYVVPVSVAAVVITCTIIIIVLLFCYLRKRLWKKDRGTQLVQQSQPAQSQDTGEESVQLISPITQQPLHEAKKDERPIPLNDTVAKAWKEAPHIRTGLSGHIQGPISYKDKECMCERIMCDRGHQATAVCANGQKWMKLNHRNLIKVFDVVVCTPAVYIVMEHAAGESVRDALDKRTDDLPMPEVLDWATQIAQGISHLHENGIVHKFIKSAQIFIVESPDMAKTLKIACSNLFGNDAIFDGISVTRKISISPPENSSTQEYDVWSFGVVLWEILTRREPYKGGKRQEVYNDIAKGATLLEIPDRCSKEMQEILNGCRSVEPARRPPLSDILRRLQNDCNC